MTGILIQNASLLVTLSFFYAIIRWYRPQKEISFQLISGLWFGIVAVAAMMIPYEYRPGTIYDGRSVVLTLAGFWGGGYSAVISAVIAGTYRIYHGGEGVWAGLATIIFCGTTGVIFRQVFKGRLNELKIVNLWVIGLVSHAFMLASQMLLPDHPLLVLENIWFPVIIILPVAFVIIARLFQMTDRYIYKNQEIKEAEELYRTTLLSIGDAVICTDEKGRITQMNKIAEGLTGWQFSEANGKMLEEVFRIINEYNRHEVESPFAKVIKNGTVVGLANHTLLISKNGNEIPIADSGAPIFSKTKIVGVVLVFRDQTEEKRQQKKLMESEAMYREREFWLRESQRVGKIGSYDLDIKNDRWSSSEILDEILGIPGNTTHNLNSWLAVVHPDHKQEMLDYFLNDVLKNKRIFEKEYKIIRRSDGVERWLLGHGELSFNEEGEPVRMFGTIQDVTERKQFERQLQESEERFRKAVLNSPIPIMVHDEDGKVITLSEGWNHFSGYQIEEIPTLAEWTRKAYGEKAKEIENYVGSIFKENKTVFSGEFEITTKTGEKRIWNFYTTPLGLSGDKRIMLSMAPDVTQRIKMKEQLEESERSYRLLFEKHTAAKFLIDPDTGEIVKANKAASDFYGWSINKLQTMNISEINILPGEEVRASMKRALGNRRVYFEFKHRLSNGSIRDVEVFSSQTEYKGKLLLHSIFHDVTDKKRLMNELIEAKERAEESNRLKSAFLANMSHEIRTPLNGIVGFTNLLTTERDLSEDAKQQFSQIINKSTDGLLKIINDILDISRLETGKSVIEQTPFDVGKLLSSVYLMFSKKLKDGGKEDVELILNTVSQTVILNSDENRLIQIFSNLLDNAIRFTQNGTVSFGISKIERGRIEFFVSDTGIGIPKEKHQIIFESFMQADASMSRSYGGTGLGLAIVRKLLELMGGEIVLESEPGKGSHFSFYLPYYENQAELTANVEQEGKDYLTVTKGLDNKTKILVVEDDEVSRFYLLNILKKRFQKLLFAENGEKALTLYKSELPDFILMDIRLPDISGLEIVKRIRKNDQKVKIIAQTAYAMSGDKENAREAGCNDFITKPVNPELLFEKLSIN